ncbi:MAG: hypothetical protein K6G69_01555 [Lachnospiraceae bacterium]|nr:hypothetical protein [Lachnospiraceae bacterium]
MVTNNNMTHGITELMKQGYKYAVNQYRIRNAQKQQIMMNQIAANNSNAIRYDLFQGFRHSNYPNLHPIVSFNNIRNHGWSIQNNSVIYRYTLAKTSAEPLPSAILQSMMSNMNTDLAGALTTLIDLYDPQYVSMFYPYLYNGVLIVSIRDLGIDVELSVMI